MPEIKIDESGLTSEKINSVQQIKNEIDLARMVSVIRYGLPTQEKMAAFSDRALKGIADKDLGTAGAKLTELMTGLKEFDVEEKRGLFGKSKRVQLSLKAMQAKYTQMADTIEQIKEDLIGQRMQLLLDINILDDLLQVNDAHLEELDLWIIAGKQKLHEARSTTLKEQQEKAGRTQDIRDIQAAKDFEEMCTAFEKKLMDLNITRTAALQLGPQIKLLQKNQSIMADKINSSITNVIPIWKSRMVVLLGLESLNKSLETQTMIDNFTNDMLKETAGKIKTASAQAASQAERQVVDAETLRQTNEDLLAAFDEVVQIQEEGKAARQDVEQELADLNSDIRNKLAANH